MQLPEQQAKGGDTVTEHRGHERKVVAVSSELSLAFMVIGLLAVAGAVVITLTRSRRAPLRPEETGSELKDELRELRSDLERRELRLVDREQRLDTELARIEARALTLDQLKSELDDLGHELDQAEAAQHKELERIAGLTVEQAKQELVSVIENQARREAALTIRDIEREAQAEGDKRARKIIKLANHREASEQTNKT